MDWLGFLHGHVGVDFLCGVLDADFGVRIVFRGFLCFGLFADFVMACADLGCGFLLLLIFLVVFPQKKP